MRRYSLDGRQAHRDEFSAEQWAILFFIDHPDMLAPVRLSTHPTEELSYMPPLFCTRSTWMTPDPAANPFLYVPMETMLPSDKEDAPAAGNIIIVNASPQIATLLRSVRDQATIHFAMVNPRTPNVLQQEHLDLLLIDSVITPGEVTINFSREPTEFEMDPEGLMTKYRFPGLHR
ncbi:hypothetical protein [Pararhizobium gei]|uniref:hypothetical protein n=1 Tax=Pararhizobium gei TaxID=1395951 RepID=UPI0023DA0B3F|nr:hypothetical protein [Rhizobium gei]